MGTQDLRFSMSKEWPIHERQFQLMAVTFPLRMVVFYRAMAETGKKLVQDMLIEKVYSQPLPQSSSWGAAPSPRTGRTLLNVKASSNGLTSRVFIDRRGFPAYFYPWILEFGRLSSPAYKARYYFRDAMRKMEVIYFREARYFLKQFLHERGML